MTDITIPDKQKGGPTKKFMKQRREFAEALKEIDDDLDKKVSPRGWGYLLENMGAIDKDQFDRIENLIIQIRTITFGDDSGRTR